MLCFHTSISMKLKHVNQFHKQKKTPNSFNQLNIPACQQFQSSFIDLIILIAVIIASGFLIFPCLKLLLFKVIEIWGLISDVFEEEGSSAPMIYSCLGISILSTLLTLLAISVCTNRKCGKPGCLGLHKAAEFDIQLETEDYVKNYSGGDNLGKDGLKLFELPRDYFRELESELKKMTPINGRAVIVFRARCGCSVGKLEVLGPKKPPRKIKK